MHNALIASFVAACFAVACVEPASVIEDRPYSLLTEVGSADAEFDETLFRSVRKDGQWVAAVTMEGRTELSLTPPVPSRLRYRVLVPETPVLRFSTGVATLGDELLAASLELELKVELDGGEHIVFSELFRRRGGNRWRSHEVDLGPWSGQEVTLVLSSRWKATREVRQPVLAAWSNPVLVSAHATRSKPDIVLVSIDCLRADHVGAYGYPRATTPSIDRVADEGVVFENAYSTASWTLPAHMSMLTGLLPSFHGATKWEKLSSSVPYLPELLSGAGYRTAGVVSWVYLSQTYGFERGFHSYRVLDDPKASDIVDAAIQELHRGQGQSQFLFLHLYDPHWPYLPPREFIERFGPRPADISDLMESTFRGTPPQDTTTVDEVVRLYDGEVAFTDRELGRFFDALESAGMYEDTLVIITSDHGEAFYEHGHWQHSQTLYEEVTRVPLIVKFPGNAPSRRSSRLVSLVDVFTTIAETAGIDAGNAEAAFLRRQSLREDPGARTLVNEVTWRSPRGTFVKIAFRDETHKYIATLKGPGGDDLGVSEVQSEELYDLRSDPEERVNLLETDGGNVDPFRADLRRFLEAARAARALRGGEAVELDEQTRKQLESLGYTH